MMSLEADKMSRGADGKESADAAASAGRVIVNPAEFPPAEKQAPRKEADQATQDVNLGMLLDIPVDIHVEIGSTRASIRDILQLGPGAIIELDRLAGQPADIIVNGKLIGQGDIVVVNETFGIRITKLVGAEERLQSVG
jgi:flagellar motor switch protein FliN/FliY